MKNPPIPKKLKKLVAHEDTRFDYYYWLRDDSRTNKEIINYLNNENTYTKFWFKKNNVNSSKIFKKYVQAIPKTEEGFKIKIDEYEYLTSSSLSHEHKKYYQIHKNKKKLLLDVNKLAKNKAFYDISGIFPSRNHNFIAFGEDTNGRREFSIIIKNIKKNKLVDKNLCSSTGNIIWSLDSKGYFYLKKNQKTLITDSLFFHKIGTDSKRG